MRVENKNIINFDKNSPDKKNQSKTRTNNKETQESSPLKTGLKVAKKLISTAATLASPLRPSATTVSLSLAARLLNKSENQEIKPQSTESLLTHDKKMQTKQPGIYFIGGFQLFSSSPFGNGIKDMSEEIEGARYFKWGQKQAILDDISTVSYTHLTLPTICSV